jgi:hypothetical protein
MGPASFCPAPGVRLEELLLLLLLLLLVEAAEEVVGVLTGVVTSNSKYNIKQLVTQAEIIRSFKSTNVRGCGLKKGVVITRLQS